MAPTSIASIRKWNKHQTPNSRKAPNSNHQAPGIAPNTKLQKVRSMKFGAWYLEFGVFLELGVWSLELFWSLVFGVWSFFPSPSPPPVATFPAHQHNGELWTNC